MLSKVSVRGELAYGLLFVAILFCFSLKSFLYGVVCLSHAGLFFMLYFRNFLIGSLYFCALVSHLAMG